MINPIFNNFFSLGEVKVGPTICSEGQDGNWLGFVNVYSTKKDLFLKEKKCSVAIREFNNIITEELYDALTYLSIDKTEFDFFINNYYLFEWENCSDPKKPDVSLLKRRAYIYSK